jgi:hypothetical protein
MSEDEAGAIQNVALLDLSTMRSVEELERIKSIRNVATVIVPEALAGALAAIPMTNVANVVPVPDGARVNAHVGALTMDGAALAAAGDAPTVLLLTGALVITSPVERVGFHSILTVGVVVAPEGSEAALTPVLRRTVGRVAYYPWVEGQAVKVFQGDTRVKGDVLANPGGGPDDIAIVAGTLVVTSPVPKLGFRRIVVVGSLVAPEETEVTLSPALVLVGDAVWYTAPPRVFSSPTRFSAGFFDLLDEPATLILNGPAVFERDVPVQLVKEKVAAIAVNGPVKASPEMVSLIQFLAVQLNGPLGPLDE